MREGGRSGGGRGGREGRSERAGEKERQSERDGERRCERFGAVVRTPPGGPAGESKEICCCRAGRGADASATSRRGERSGALRKRKTVTGLCDREVPGSIPTDAILCY